MRKPYPSQSKLKNLFNYDKSTGILTRVIDRGKALKGDLAGHIDKRTGYLRIKIDYELYYGHRIAWIIHYGYDPEHQIDHIDRNPLNNAIDNLREVSQYCNMRNTGNPKNNVSKIKGVHWDKKSKKWKAYIIVINRHCHLGLYDDFSDAVLARLAAEQCLGWSGCDSNSPAYKFAIANIFKPTASPRPGAFFAVEV